MEESKNNTNTNYWYKKIIDLYDNDSITLYNSHEDIKLKTIDELNNEVPCMFKLDPKLDLINDWSNIIFSG